MKPDAGFWPDMGLLVLLLATAVVANLISRRIKRGMVPQQPGDIDGLTRNLSLLSCSTAVAVLLMCGVLAVMGVVWGNRP